MSEAAIFTEGLSKSFGAQAAVRELSLRIQPGAVYGFLGRNGAGKTTTMRMLLGLVRPTKGSARVLGLDPGRETELIRILERVAFVPQRKQLYGWATPAELRINPNTVARAYQDLERDGVTRSVPGGGTFVADGLPGLLKSEKVKRLRPHARQLAVEGRQLRLTREETVKLLEEELDKLGGQA